MLVSLFANREMPDQTVVNRISSIYGKAVDSIGHWIEDGKLLYLDDTKETPIVLQRLQLPSALQASSNRNIIRKSRIVNSLTQAGEGVSVLYQGYDWSRGMSNNAVAAYEAGEKPMSKWTNAAINEAIDNDSGASSEVAERLKALPKEAKQAMLLEYASWHHTGKYYNRTRFFSNIDLDTIGLAVMSISDPLAVFDSVDSKGDIRKNQLVVVTEVENDKGEKVVVPLHMQETADRIEVDIIASAYFKGSSGVYDKWASLGALKYLKNNEVGSQLMPLQLRGRENQPLLQKVLQRTDVVNKYSYGSDMLYQNDITPEDNAVAEAKTFSSWEDWHGYATFMLELDENETARAWDEAHAVPKEVQSSAASIAGSGASALTALSASESTRSQSARS